MQPTARVAVAFSGGRDSTALLHVTVRAALTQGVEVVALHINHGLSADADRWHARAVATCRRWARAGAPLRCVAHRLPHRPPAGESIEAWARDARYAALTEMAHTQSAGLVLLGHHQGDQAETFLLQALRGGGVAGLAAMPRRIERDGIVWARPWLSHSRDDIDAYLRRHRLAFVEDESNAEPRYARNRLRCDVMPVLGAAFPGAQAALALAAQHAHEAVVALAELAAIDLAAAANSSGLELQPWRALSVARRSNVLRSWLRSALGSPAPATLVERLLSEWRARDGLRQWPCTGGRLVAWRGVLRFRPTPTRPLPSSADGEVHLTVTRPGRYAVAAWAGCLEVAEAVQGGVAWGRLARIRLGPRRGGEQFKPSADRPARSLKKQFQAMGVPPGCRGGPLVHSGELLLYVPGLGIDSRALATAAEPQASLRWIAGELPTGRD